MKQLSLLPVEIYWKKIWRSFLSFFNTRHAAKIVVLSGRLTGKWKKFGSIYEDEFIFTELSKDRLIILHKRVLFLLLSFAENFSAAFVLENFDAKLMKFLWKDRGWPPSSLSLPAIPLATPLWQDSQCFVKFFKVLLKSL